MSFNEADFFFPRKIIPNLVLPLIITGNALNPKIKNYPTKRYEQPSYIPS